MRKLLPLVVVLGFAVLASVPAQAASLQFSDAPDDAREPATPVVPSEPALDITRVGLTSDGRTLTYVATVKQLAGGNPSASLGSYFRFYLSHDGTQFAFVVYEKSATDSGSYLPHPDDPTVDLSCAGCKGAFDRKTNTVTATLPLKSLGQGMQQYQPDLPPLGPGTRLTALAATASRSLELLSVVADYAYAPAFTYFTL